MSVVQQLPEMFMALAFMPSCTNNNNSKAADDDNKNKFESDEFEACRLATTEYLLPRLQAKLPTLSLVEIQFQQVEWGRSKPEPKFHVYWKADVSMTFEQALVQHAKAASPQELFDRVGELFCDHHYLEFLRDHPRINKGQFRWLSTAEEVRVGLAPQSTEGGAVKAPNFYMGFVCDPPPTQKPTKEQLERLRAYALPKMLTQIRNSYPGSFDEGITLNVVKSEINEKASKPVDCFNLYIEFEAVGIFRKDAPPSMQFFAELSSFPLEEFLHQVDTIGGPLSSVTKMVINPCAWIEDLVEADPAIGEGDGEPIPIHVEFWLALVIPALNRVPNEQQIAVFDDMMKEFLRETLLRSYGPKSFHSSDLQRSSCEVNANVPLPRFNILHRYTADVYFCGPLPPPSQVLSKIMRCDVGALMSKISTLPSPWSGTMEGTLGTAMFQKPSKEKAYDGRILSSPKSVTNPPTLPIKQSPLAANDKGSRPRPTKNSKKHSDPKQSSPTPTKPVIKAAKEYARKAAIPANATPNRTATTIEHTADIFLALTIQDNNSELTRSEFGQLAKITQSFYTDFLSKRYKGSFQDISVRVRTTKCNSGIPEPKYNVYVEWDIKANFLCLVDQHNKQAATPSRIEICQALASEIDLFVLLKDKIRGELHDTPFENSVAIYTEQVNSIVQNDDSKNDPKRVR